MKLHRLLSQAAAKGLSRHSSSRAKNIQSNNATTHPSAGIIVIGDELLKAQVKDTNSFYACACLYKLGVNVKKISVISDNVYDIAREIQEFSAKYKYVITSGGIGPTHDDVTYEALAMAFNDKLHHDATLVDIIKNIFGYVDVSSPGFKMAQIPTKSKLKFGVAKTTGKKLSYPCVILDNVHVFPGSPLFFKASFDSLYEELFPHATDFHMSELFINANETTFADTLTAIAKEYPHVSFGSYPEYSRYYKVRVTVESRNAADTKAAVEKLRAVLPAEVIAHHDRVPHKDCLAKFENLLRRLPPAKQELYKNTFSSLLKLYRRPRRVAIYFDGSPESITLVHLSRVVLMKAGLVERIQVVCFENEINDADLNRFLQSLSESYNIDTIHSSCKPNLQEALRNLALQNNKLTTLLVGSRKTDLTSTISDAFANLGENKYLKVDSPLFDWTKLDIDVLSKGLSLPYFEKSS